MSNNTVAVPGFSCPNPIPRPFDTETDSDPDLASPFTLSDDLQLHRSYYQQLSWSGENGFPKNPPHKGKGQGLDPHHPHGQVENVTAPSAGGSQGPAGRSGWESGFLFGRPLAIGLGIV